LGPLVKIGFGNHMAAENDERPALPGWAFVATRTWCPERFVNCHDTTFWVAIPIDTHSGSGSNGETPKKKPSKPIENPKQTSPKVASAAARVLNDSKATKPEKAAAASALSQTRPKAASKPKSGKK
jgi:hypothetical protein